MSCNHCSCLKNLIDCKLPKCCSYHFVPKLQGLRKIICRKIFKYFQLFSWSKFWENAEFSWPQDSESILSTVPLQNFAGLKSTRLLKILRMVARIWLQKRYFLIQKPIFCAFWSLWYILMLDTNRIYVSSICNVHSVSNGIWTDTQNVFKV